MPFPSFKLPVGVKAATQSSLTPHAFDAGISSTTWQKRGSECLDSNGPQPFVLIEPCLHDLYPFVIKHKLDPPCRHNSPSYAEPPREVIKASIRNHVKREIVKIKELRSDLPVDWPGEYSIDGLMNLIDGKSNSVDLAFILTNTGDVSLEQLGKQIASEAACVSALQQDRDGKLASEDYVYHRLLCQCVYWAYVSSRDPPDVEETRHIPGLMTTVVVLTGPITNKALAQIMDLSLDKLHQLMGRCPSLFTSSEPYSSFRTICPQFAAFIYDPQRSRAMHIVEGEEITDETVVTGRSKVHSWLARRCVRLLQQQLHQNMSSSQAPGTRRQDAASDTVLSALPEAIAYACQYWSHHLVQGVDGVQDGDIIHHFLETHFLHWIEALSWLGIAHESIPLITAVQNAVSPSSQVAKFLFDAKSFMHRNGTMAQQAPLQLYHSGLLFTPNQNEVKQHFRHDMLTRKSLLRCRFARWNPEIGYLSAHAEFPVTFVTFSRDGQNVISTSEDRRIRVWDINSGRMKREIDAKFPARFAAISPDGRMIATPGTVAVHIWDIRTGRRVHTLHLESDCKITAVAFSPDSKWVTAGLAANDLSPSVEYVAVEVWELARAGVVLARYTKATPSAVRAVTFAQGGALVVAGSSEKHAIHIWTVKTGELVDRRGPSDFGLGLKVVFSPDSQLAAYLRPYEKIKIEEIMWGPDLTCETGGTESFECAAFSPVADQRCLAVGTNHGEITLCSVATGELTHRFDASGPITALAHSPDGHMLASGNAHGEISLWDKSIKEEGEVRDRHNGRVTVLTISPDGKYVLSGGKDGRLKLWNMATGERLVDLRGEGDRVTAAAWSPDGRHIVVGSMKVQVWNAETGLRVHCLRISALRGPVVSALAVSHDGGLIAAGTSNMCAQLLDIKTGQLVRLVGSADTSDTCAIAFSPDCRWLATGSSRDVVKVWSLETGERACRNMPVTPAEAKSPGFEPPGIISLLFSPTSDLIAVGLRDTVVVMKWNGAEMKQLELGRAHKPYRFMSFSADGRRLHTNLGDLKVDTLRQEDKAELTKGKGKIHVTSTWIVHCGADTLWLPEEYQHSLYACMGDTLVIGHRSGDVSILNFAEPIMVDD